DFLKEWERKIVANHTNALEVELRKKFIARLIKNSKLAAKKVADEDLKIDLGTMDIALQPDYVAREMSRGTLKRKDLILSAGLSASGGETGFSLAKMMYAEQVKIYVDQHIRRPLETAQKRSSVKGDRPHPPRDYWVITANGMVDL